MFFFATTQPDAPAPSSPSESASTTEFSVVGEISEAAREFDRALETLRTITSLEAWIGFGSLVLLGLILALLINRLLHWKASSIAKKNPESIIKDILQMVQAPLGIFIFTYFLSMGVDVLKLPGWLWMRVHYTFMPMLYAIAIVFFLFRLTELGARLLHRRYQVADTEVDEYLLRLLVKLVKLVIVLMALLFFIDSLVGLGKIIPLLAGLGFLGAALALAAQHTLANVFAALSLVLDKVFKMGDRIRFENYDGFVIKMGLRSTKLISMSGEIITLPNRELAEKQVRNLSSKGQTLTEIFVRLPYQTARARIEEAIAILNGLHESNPAISRHTVSFTQIAPYSIEIASYVWSGYRTPGQYNEFVTGVNSKSRRLLTRLAWHLHSRHKQ
ncbi:mechanosensitive ion channel [Oscillatoria amoena NRMC-F 0135]|uniref:Mechanosensitive ion channel n=1 Tax=Geitlerinema calcuttense NRMC-F 0142 TaxID=2922238 RepID=A0ABT7M061_9CYAN|nr:mechanosensitive ion channel domain-containing protein [Geitlerinema calcuttense]MDL5050403.1 mechanosensitive ion channel [Oscillatoria amoena NRMC-F 0135]MDL5057449.1 mechanosensitive ion channel [Geitlerinema calcuttense NRMC-F 0142]